MSSTIANLPDGVTANSTDRLPIERSPFGAGQNFFITPSYIRTFVMPIVEADITLANNTTNNVSTSKHGFAPILPNDATKFLDGTGAYSVPAGSATLNGITAATGAITIASGNNTGIVWNWANTTDSTIAFTYGETSAATNGTSTSNIPNQVLLKLTTLSASTQSPLSVYSRGSHVFSVSPTQTQILSNAGSASNPAYSFTNSVSTGIYSSIGTSINFASGGTQKMQIASQIRVTAGSAGSAGLTDLTSAHTGIAWVADHQMSVVDTAYGAELVQFNGAANVAYFTQGAVTFANLPAAANGSQLYCSDCDPATLINSVCASSGAKTGAMAARVNAQWICYT